MGGETAKPIRLSEHAARYALTRGFEAAEVRRAIREAPWQRAEGNRMECRLDFPYNNTWNGRRYATKRVRPFFVEEPDEIVVVTVITYYF
jgi:hypothetical protein